MNKPILNSKQNSFLSKRFASIVFSALFIPFAVSAQNADIKTQWQHADMATDGLPGVSAVKAHAYMAEKGKTATPVVVAIIDSGSETFHKDLNANIWTNKGEIADNGIDDDKNGYIDDVHGWSFIGGKGGDVKQDNLEFTRVYAMLKQRFEGKEAASIAAADKADFAKYEKIKVEFEKRVGEVKEEAAQFNAFLTTFKANKEVLAMALGNDFTAEQLAAYEPTDDAAKAAHEQRKRENIAKYGASDWYDWCCANWGVKWDFGYDENKDRKKASVGTRNGKPTLTLAFDTAWAPPFKFYEQMRDEYEYDIRAYYSELGVGFVGSLHNGVENTISIEEFTQEWLEDNVPAKICAMFHLYEQAAEIEELNKEAENEAE